MSIQLNISATRIIKDVQHDFNSQYPYLKMEFYKVKDIDEVIRLKEHLPHSAVLKIAGIKKAGVIDINDEMTVAELENIFLEQYGLNMQVSRRSGNIWLETTMTDAWTLRKQNEYGREITSPLL